MSVVSTIVPEAGRATAEAVLARVAAAPALEPFSALAVDACDELSRALLRERAYPEVAALGFWLRRANVQKLRASFLAGMQPGSLAVARGLAFHVPPANVDTMALFSLSLSLLVGNRNVVRLSPRAGGAAAAAMAALRRVLAQERFAALREGTAVVTYGHEPGPTAAFSAACDVRLVWGGDATVAALRAVPVCAGAKDLGFGDRFSLAAIDVDAYTTADRDALAAALYADAYPFDQGACSSPKLLVWVGRVEPAAAASVDLFDRLGRLVAERHGPLPTGAVTAKLAFTFGAAIDLPVTRVRRPSNALTVITLATLDGFTRKHPGAGLFFESCVQDVAELARHVTRCDQTICVHGVSPAPLAAAGADRVVQFGHALDFDHRWDGMDLLHELTRRAVVEVAA
jgi:hypothetical protein